MKGILLTGGLGTRLYPTTIIINKHLLPVYDRPMFYWPLQTLIASGISQIAIVSGPPNGEQIKTAIEYFPRKKDVKFTFITQNKPLGIPDAVSKCKKFIGKDPFILFFGDTFCAKDFKNDIKNFDTGAVTFIRKVKNPSAFGVVIFDNKNKITDIIEKPKKFISDWAVIVPYIFDNSVFDKIKKLKPSKRGEFEIVDLLKLYAKEGKLKLVKKRDTWIDAGTPDNLLKASIIAKRLVS